MYDSSVISIFGWIITISVFMKQFFLFYSKLESLKLLKKKIIKYFCWLELIRKMESNVRPVASIKLFPVNLQSNSAELWLTHYDCRPTEIILTFNPFKSLIYSWYWIGIQFFNIHQFKITLEIHVLFCFHLWSLTISCYIDCYHLPPI